MFSRRDFLLKICAASVHDNMEGSFWTSWAFTTQVPSLSENDERTWMGMKFEGEPLQMRVEIGS